MDQGANVKTHTNKVHTTHPTLKVRGCPVPLCMSRTQIMNLHYAVPTDAPVDCVKCQNKLARIAKSQAAKAARQAAK